MYEHFRGNYRKAVEGHYQVLDQEHENFAANHNLNGATECCVLIHMQRTVSRELHNMFVGVVAKTLT